MNPEDAPNAGSGRRRAAAFLLSCLCLTLALAATTVHYTVGVEGGRVVVDAMGHRFLGPPVDTGEPLLVLFLSQGRHSTGQTLMRDRGALVNGLRALAFIAGRNHERPQEFRVPLAERWSFVHFNPFRSTLSVRVGEPELRLEVNIPDASIEAWDRGTKHDTVQLRSPWLRLTIAPLLAALAAAVCLLAGLGVWPRRIRTLAPRAPRPEVPGPPSRTAAEASLIGAAGALLVGAVLIGAFDAMPGFGDEMNYLIQGKIFASGRLWVPPPPEPEFYRVGWMDMQGADGKVWGFHPPGNSALLALGWLAGVHWLTVPLVGGALLAVQYLLGLELFRRRSAAWIHVGLVATSHYVLSLASSFMAHAPSLLLLSLFLLFLLRFDDRGRGRDLVLAAVCSGLAFTVRPLSAVLAAVVPLVAIAPRLRRRHLGAALASLALGMTLVASVFAYTWGITGSWELPYLVKGPEAGQTLSVRLAKGVDVHLANLYRNSNELQHRAHSFGILGNAVLFFVGLLAAGRGSGRRRLRIAASSFVFFVVAHSVLHWYGWKWEPRMLYDVSFLAFLVSAAGLA
ncbi:MAG: glycosyltransferase family 39 protein, partial [Acidobacteriota bacterium]